MKTFFTIIHSNLYKGASISINLFNCLFIAFIILFTSENIFAQSCANYVITRNAAVTYTSIAYIYCDGINSTLTSGTPFATQQTANISSFGSSDQNSLSAKPTNNYEIPVNGLKQGDYLIKIFSNDILINNSKLVIE